MGLRRSPNRPRHTTAVLLQRRRAATATHVKGLSGTVAGTASLASSVSKVGSLASAITGTGAVAGTAARARGLAAASTGSATLTGAADRLNDLATQIALGLGWRDPFSGTELGPGWVGAGTVSGGYLTTASVRRRSSGVLLGSSVIVHASWAEAEDPGQVLVSAGDIE